jgi:magnesium chelatase family protein
MISLNSIIFNGMDATRIDVHVQLATGLSNPEFNIIGLADRAVKESAERIRNVISALNLQLPPKRLTVNLSPADVEKMVRILIYQFCAEYYARLVFYPKKNYQNI